MDLSYDEAVNMCIKQINSPLLACERRANVNTHKPINYMFKIKLAQSVNAENLNEGSIGVRAT